MELFPVLALRYRLHPYLAWASLSHLMAERNSDSERAVLSPGYTAGRKDMEPRLVSCFAPTNSCLESSQASLHRVERISFSPDRTVGPSRALHTGFLYADWA